VNSITMLSTNRKQTDKEVARGSDKSKTTHAAKERGHLSFLPPKGADHRLCV
jgi:hypothetical protein